MRIATSTLRRAALTQAVAVFSLFALLLALPLPVELFRQWGALIGPLSWLACALIAARVVGLRLARAVAAAGVSGLLAIGASLAGGHLGGIIVGILAFGLACSLRREPSRGGGGGDRTGGLRLERPSRDYA